MEYNNIFTLCHHYKKSKFHLHQRSPSDDLMYWTVKAGRTRENNELIHLENLLKQIGKHLTTIRKTGQIMGRITERITGQITGRITGWFTGRITERITKCKRKDAFLWKVGSLLKENDAKEKRRQNAFFHESWRNVQGRI